MFKRTSANPPAQPAAGGHYAATQASEHGSSQTALELETPKKFGNAGLPTDDDVVVEADAEKMDHDERAWLAAIAFEEARDAEAYALEEQFGPEDFDCDEHRGDGEQGGTPEATPSPPNIDQEAMGVTASVYAAIRWPGRLTTRRGT